MMRSTPHRSARRALLLLAALVVAMPAAADQAVVFEDGRTLEVANVIDEGDTLRLELLEGGAMSVPAWRVTHWTRLERRQEGATTTVATARPTAADAWRRVAGMFAEHIAQAAAEHRLDPVLLTAVARTESSFDPSAVSPKGASGLMQLMPMTAERFGVTDIFDVAENVNAGAEYLRWLLERFGGDTELALAGYNAGENAVARYNGVPPYPETRNYVRKVMLEADRLRTPGAAPAAREDIRLTSVAPAVAD